MSDGFEVINDTADDEGSDSEGASIGRRRLFQMGAVGVAAVGAAAVADSLMASPAGAADGSALLIGGANTSSSTNATALSGGNGINISTKLGGAGHTASTTTVAIEGSSPFSSTITSIGVKGTGFTGVQGISNGTGTVGLAGVQGIGNSSWVPGLVASNANFPTLHLAPSATTTLPVQTVSPPQPVPGSFIVLSDGSLHYAPQTGQWMTLAQGGTGFSQGSFCLLPNPIRILDTRPGGSAAINPGLPISSGVTFTLQVTGETVQSIEIPAGAIGVIGNITVANPTGPGYLTLFPTGAARPTASGINYVAGQSIANGVTVKLSSAGRIDIYAKTTTDVIFDAVGFIA